MRIFAIADPHLSKGDPKPMDIFGGNWEGHPDVFFERWQDVVGEDDLVLIPGDISWAMRLEGAMLDLNDIAALNGQKVLLRGNHDYWWDSIGKLRKALPKGMFAIQNDALRFESETGAGFVIAGARGWNCPDSFDFGEKDEKIYLREVERLKLSLLAAQKLLVEGDKLIVMLHFPPTNFRLEPSHFTTLIAEHNPDILVYGHIHGLDTTKENAPKILLDFKDIIGFENPAGSEDPADFEDSTRFESPANFQDTVSFEKTTGLEDAVNLKNTTSTSKTKIYFVAADALAFKPALLLEL